MHLGSLGQTHFLEWFILWNSNSGKCQCLGKITHEYLKDVSARPKRG